MIKNKVNNITSNHLISDLVSRIRNRALSPNNNIFEVIYSKDTKYILDLLAEDGYLNWELSSTPCRTTKSGLKTRPQILVQLNTDYSGKVLLQTINTRSKPGKRIYSRWKSLLQLTKDHSALIRTSSGIFTLTKAIELKIGGEILLTYK